MTDWTDWTDLIAATLRAAGITVWDTTGPTHQEVTPAGPGYVQINTVQDRTGDVLSMIVVPEGEQ